MMPTAMAGGDDATTVPGTAPVDDGAGPVPGRRWARYQVIALLGEGGMGAVYEARDAELDRAVALKVLHDELLGRAGQERLRREARAMARVAHPNVVPVYEVGEHAGRSYYTMELVRGQSLKEWAGCARPWRDVQRVFLDAARGLAAIHGAGLLHRDIKPGNLLLGDDGRARVTDLGIALGDPSALDGGALVDTTTVRNAGTPAYMAPEQLGGEPGDVRSDQFAFGVSLFESLHGVAPFYAESLPARLHAIETGPGPAIRATPRWLDEVARRAVAADPGERFGDMASLIRALEGPRPRRWPYLLAGVAAVSTALMIGLSVRAQRPVLSAECAAAGGGLDAVWGPAQRDDLRGHAPTLEAIGRIDGLADQWRLAARGICQRSHGTGSWTADLTSRASVCMQYRAEELRLEIAQLARGTVSDGRSTMSPLRCLDRGFLLAQPDPPDDPAMMVISDVVSALLGLIIDQVDLGDHRIAEPLLDAVAPLVAHVDFTPQIAKLADLRASVLRQRGDHRAALIVLEDCYYAMRGRGDDAAAQRSATLLAGLATNELADDALAAHWMKTALADAARRPDIPGTGDVYYTAAAYALNAGDLGAAAAHAERAIELSRRDFGDDSMTTASAIGMKAVILDSAGRPGDALPFYQQQLAVLTRWYGPDHPRLAMHLANQALASSALGQHDQAIALQLRAVALLDGATTNDPLELGRGLLNLGVVRINAGQDGEAVAPLRRALEVLRGALGDDHPDVALTRANLGEALSRTAGDDPAALQAAIVELRGAVEATRRAAGDDHPETATAEHNLASALRRTGRCDQAEPLAEHALAVATRTDNPLAAGYPLQLLGECAFDAGRLDAAVALLERAIAARAGADPWLRATTRRMLVLAHLGRHDDAAARDAMRARRADLAASNLDPTTIAASLGAIDAWLLDLTSRPPP